LQCDQKLKLRLKFEFLSCNLSLQIVGLKFIPWPFFGVPSGTPKNGHGIEKGLVDGNIYPYIKLCYIASKVHEAKGIGNFLCGDTMIVTLEFMNESSIA